MSCGNRRDRGALIALALGLFAIVATAWISNPSHNPVAAPGTGEEEQYENGDIEKLVAAVREFNPWSDSYAQWLMAVFAVAATGVSIWAVRLVRDQLALTRQSNEAAITAAGEAVKSNEIALRTAIIQQRAWITADGWDLKGVGDPTRGLDAYEIAFKWRNTGSTPALSIYSITGRADEPGFSPGERPDFAAIAKGQSQIAGPAEKFVTKVHVTPEEIFHSRNDPIIIRSAIEYDTVFPEPSRRITDITLVVRYVGMPGLAEIRAGNIGQANFICRAQGDVCMMD